MHSGRILVVAPNDDLRRSVTFALAAYGYAVTAEALWSDRDLYRFDCIVLDENALAGLAPVEPISAARRPILLLAYSEIALASTLFDRVIAMPLKGEAVIQAVSDALEAVRAGSK